MPRETKPKIPLVGDTVLIEAVVMEPLDDDGDIYVECRGGQTHYVRPASIVKITAGPPRKDDVVIDTSRSSSLNYVIVALTADHAWLQQEDDPTIQYLAEVKNLERVNNT